MVVLVKEDQRSVISHIDMSESDMVTVVLEPGQRLGISLFAVSGGLKVAGLSESGIAHSFLSVGDFILSVNGKAVLTEKAANKLLSTPGHLALEVKRASRDGHHTARSCNPLRVIQIGACNGRVSATGNAI
ncbi:hypothetical protein AB1Y20_012633 [Prymnesium parvum]|uniref:PDZ domain-containing protein n=1 Tax=Prymnesium parvum TaxID=97485 RepID=A0AB34ILD0_PRYPA|mmetsp:Transcript_13745/g.34312  ORF Transcript_13745/g.34312 Transcript_13745/m.34312 type:complete len:131 (+) Transcript_13745:152-544(+)|eukprot:CAMPEP_0182828128 /NCGR_PEP_ID=MMETSP0006_2-20121128/17305_1 /TAXON_ID=97485 /ORGANISM="Prymnesium parvum, Strain Texoma1" /LENGTH=130 /DNA_ID=CAMNT_0024955465 /DNA_START=136 /DNA_END=528 /DNA_ORIENTATION=+